MVTLGCVAKYPNIAGTLKSFAETAKQAVKRVLFGADIFGRTCCPNMESATSSPRSRNQSGDPDQEAFPWKFYDMEQEHPDFTTEDELSSLTLLMDEGCRLYVHKEVLAAWSPVFKSMFTRDFREKEMREIELPGKNIDDFQELLHCMYPPIKPVYDGNVYQLLPLAEEYQVSEVKKRCEEFLLTKPGSMELLVTAQCYNLTQLLQKCIEFARTKSFSELQADPYYKTLESDNLIQILTLRVQDLEMRVESSKRAASERDAKLYGCINELATGYGNFCTECKSRKVNEQCFNCLKMFRDKVQKKCEEAKVIRQSLNL